MTYDGGEGEDMRAPGRDELRAALRAAATEPPVTEVDWEALVRGVRHRAEPLLAARRRPLPWWGHASRWARAGIPLAAAAVLALVLLLPRAGLRTPTGETAATTPTAGSSAAGPADAASPSSAEADLSHLALAAPGTGDPVLAYMEAADGGEALLLSALEEE